MAGDTLNHPRPVIELHGVTKGFQSGDQWVPVLNGVEFQAMDGTLTMIVGPSGCGKTTLLSIIAGTLHPDAGHVRVFGHEVEQLDAHQLNSFRARDVGFVFQQFHLISTLTVQENVMIPKLIQGASEGAAAKAASDVLEQVGLSHMVKRRPNQLSGGEQQRVAIARGLVHQPRVLICDEPTSALDSETGKKIVKLIIDIARRPGRCLVIVTHDSRIYHYADMIAQMEDGVIKAMQTPDQLQGY
jgi:putative ABC transport system ATP-binding protein